MILATEYNVPIELIKKASNTTLLDIFRHPINQPAGDFFYDPWKIKDEFIGTVWEEILKTLPFVIGEARIIVLNQAECYSSHSDIDDRWHLNISSKEGYLINLDLNKMFKLVTDGIWYDMNAGYRHTAVNFGNRPRIQLVVRKLLTRSNRTDLVPVKITTVMTDLEDARYEFDNSISSFLNLANKDNAINNFKYTNAVVSMDLAPEYITQLKAIVGSNFKIN